MVPTLMENCFLQSRHFHIKRVLRNEVRFDWHCGQAASPFSHRSAAKNRTQVRGSEKYWIASISEVGAFTGSMTQ
jgi:hypothetical protein